MDLPVPAENITSDGPWVNRIAGLVARPDGAAANQGNGKTKVNGQHRLIGLLEPRRGKRIGRAQTPGRIQDMEGSHVMESMQTHTRCGRFDRLVNWLAVKDPQKNRAAVTHLSRPGRRGMEVLIDEAIGRGKQPDQRIAILDVVVRIGEPLGPTEFFKLQSLLHHKVPRVREKAAEVFMALSASGPPKSPEAATFLRRFHPAFWTPPRRSRRPSPLTFYKAHCR